MLKKLLKKFKKTKKRNVNRHFIFVEAPIDLVAPEVILWGEASWWPKKCSMKFIRKTEGDIKVGTRYVQKVMRPFAPRWKVEITKLVPGRLIRRTFLNGIFDGYEVLKIGERANGTRIDYELYYIIRGPINMILWPILYRKMHDKNIELILQSLRDYVVENIKVKQEKEYEGK